MLKRKIYIYIMPTGAKYLYCIMLDGGVGVWKNDKCHSMVEVTVKLHSSVYGIQFE